MLSNYFYYIVVLTLSFRVVEPRICGNVRIQNNLTAIERDLRGCTLITGGLAIVLLEYTTEEDFEQYSFPELLEIEQYVLLFRVTGLTSIGKLFPNLKVIRGQLLFENFAFVLQDIKDLREIGLSNLQLVERGSVRIGACQQLCYVNTIDWSKLGTSLKYADDVLPTCPSCSSNCTDGCWSQDVCQKTNRTLCPNFQDNDKCVSECPPNKYIFGAGKHCITKEECYNVKWFPFDGHCTDRCPAKHEMVGKDKGWCRYCGDDCKKVCVINARSDIKSLSDSERLEGCTYINGSLKITVTSEEMLNELEKHMGSIREIDGILSITRSNFLQSLNFLKNLTVIHGRTKDGNNSLIVHNNPDLYKLWDRDNLEIRRGTFSFHDNPQLCLSDIERLANITKIKYSTFDVSPYSNGEQRACVISDLNVRIVNLNPTNVTISCDENTKTNTVVGYFIYYIEDQYNNISIFAESCIDDGWDTIFTRNNTFDIVDLKPFTKYAFYIKTSENLTVPSRQTDLKHFETLSGDPSPPQKIKAISTNYSTMLLSWERPEETLGVLSHYNIIRYTVHDRKSFIDVRDYCKYPHHLYSRVDDFASPSFKNDTCKPNIDCKPKTPKPYCNLYGDAQDQTCKNEFVYSIGREHGGFQMYKRSGPEQPTNHIVNANETNYLITNLQQYTMYVFFMTACNVNRTMEHQCSEVVMLYNRTAAKPDADDIIDLQLTVIHNNVSLKWSDPDFPNSLIVSYQVEYRSTDRKNAETKPHCITRRRHEKANNVFNLTHFAPGGYAIRVRAISLAGPGRFTAEKPFTIEFQTDYDVLIWVSSICGVLVISLIPFIIWYCKYKRKRRLEKHHLIPTINPEYVTYVEDEWEIERSNVEIHNELGKGQFGMVYSGLIKSQNLPCAIKTVNASATLTDKTEFLNEASVMKSFSDAHHVVKLLGVVSKAEPALVLMELMACGDLKMFLRRSRDSSQSITSNEMFRMAAEIADGMAYLAAKKFIHRDLAARNCMVSGDHTIKIGDFGMARDIYETDYYRKGSKGLLPVRWMAPESLADGVFTTDSDVWSYGVVLWEMVTLAEQPYQGLASEQVLQFVKNHGTLERPQDCPDILYDIMSVCWKWYPNQRPMFIDIVQKLEKHVAQSFRWFSFYHSKEGEEFRLNGKERPVNAPAMSSRNENVLAHYNAMDGDVSLYPGEQNRPNTLLSYSALNDTQLSDYGLSENSPNNGYTSFPLSPL